ncbi:PDZ domain-containing protein [bacterium]|nr:PDZ domain-containing protein [candidate division CSSED10-310 bacterium]
MGLIIGLVVGIGGCFVVVTGAMSESMPAAVMGSVRQAVVQVIATASLDRGGRSGIEGVKARSIVGSGFAYGGTGYFITTYGVVAGAENIEILLADGRREAAHLVAMDGPSQIAVLQADIPGIVPLRLTAATIRDGSEVVVVAYSVQGIMTIARGLCATPPVAENELPDLVTVTAPMYDGNPGGLVMTSDGELAGMLLGKAWFANPVGGDNEGAGAGKFANPTNFLNYYSVPARFITTQWLDWIVRQVIEHRMVRRGWLGLTIEESYLDDGPVVLVKEVTAGGPAEKVGLRSGDRIERFDGRPVRRVVDLIRRIQFNNPGVKVSLGIRRSDRVVDFEIILGESPSQIHEDEHELPYGIGLRVTDQVEGERKGAGVVRVTGVERDSNADRAGLRPGDIVRSANGAAVDSVDRLLEVLAANRASTVMLELAIGDREVRLVLDVP